MPTPPAPAQPARFRRILDLQERRVLGDAYPVWAVGETCCKSNRASWCCTRPAGHAMPHAAHIATHSVTAIWTDEVSSGE